MCNPLVKILIEVPGLVLQCTHHVRCRALDTHWGVVLFLKVEYLTRIEEFTEGNNDGERAADHGADFGGGGEDEED